MKINDISFTFHTVRIKECVDFYVKYFGARVTFDCGWYVTIRFHGATDAPLSLSFMSPEYSSNPTALEGGITLNIGVEDVDAEYAKIKAAGHGITRELEDQKWGDRSFEVTDPIGNILYIYIPIEISEEYRESMLE